jgi:hypothetical protein
MAPKDLFLVLNLRLRLDDSISIIASILREPLIHVIVSLGRVIQVIQIIYLMWTIHQPRRALPIVLYDHVEEVGLQKLRLCIYQDHLMRHRGFLLGNHLHGGILFNDLLRRGSRWHRCRGCGGVPFVIVIIILVVVILSHAVESILFSHLHEQLITGLDHSFQGSLLLPQLLRVFPQPLAHGLQLCDLLA